MMKFYTKSLSFIVAGTVLSLSANAQVFMNNAGAKMNIATGSYLNVDGTFENQTGGAIENNGTIEVLTNWTNNDASGVFSTNAGTVILDGSGAQTIGGSNATFFNNLTLSSLNGTSPTTMAIDATVGGGTLPGTGVLSLGTRTLILGTTDDYDLTINNPNSTAITTTTGQIRSENGADANLDGGSAGLGYSYVNWKIGTSGNGSSYVIPFGTAAGVSIPFIYAKTTAGTGSAGVMKFATYPTTDANTPWANTVTGLDNVYGQASHLYVVDRFWIIEHQGYTSGSATMPHSTYTFTWDPLDIIGNSGINPADGSQLRAQRFNQFLPGGGWGDWLYSPAYTPTNTLTISIANDYSGGPYGGDYLPVWTLVDESNPLPIELIRFAGNCADGQVEVTWTTASETNNDFFTVQRSIDGVTFEDVTIVDGAGNSSSIINYSAVDYNPYGGTSYYRLKQTDFDGTSQYSDVVAVSCGNAATDFNLVNAYDQGNGTMAVVFNAGDNELYTVTLYDIIGKQITETTGKAYSGQNQINIAVGDLARGIYMVNLKNEFKSFGRRVMLH